MFASVTALPDVSFWARGSGLEIVLLVTGAILLTRFATWLGGRITDRIDASAGETDALVRSEASKHRHALASVITWVTLVVIYCVTGVAILARLGIPVTSLIAPAAVAAVAPVCVHDDLASREAAIAHRSADHEAPRGIDVVVRVLIQ